MKGNEHHNQTTKTKYKEGPLDLQLTIWLPEIKATFSSLFYAKVWSCD